MSVLRNLELVGAENPAVSLAEKQAVAAWTAGKSPHTARQYATTLRLFLTAAGVESVAAACPSLALAEKSVLAFEKSMADLAPATRQSRLSGLRMLLQHCARREVCPVVDWCVPETNSPDRTPATCPSIGQALHCIEAEPDCEVQLLMRLLYGTGLRISEALSLGFENFIREPSGRMLVYLVGKGNKARTIEVEPENWEPAPLLHALGADLKYRGEMAGWQGKVVQKPCAEAKMAYDALRKGWARIGVTEILDVTGQFSHFPAAHEWRRCFVTHTQQLGGTREAVQIVAGHTRAETTERYSLRAAPNPGRLLGGVGELAFAAP